MGNFTLYRSWTPRMTLRSYATHAPGSGLISTDARPDAKSKNSKFYQNMLGTYRVKQFFFRPESSFLIARIILHVLSCGAKTKC